jgi:tRNA (cytidine/uridine-2'-O-)-methyltransferase
MVLRAACAFWDVGCFMVLCSSEYTRFFFGENWQDFLEQNKGAELYFFTAKGGTCYADIDYPDGAYLVFGKESVGLPDELVNANLDRCVRIPMLPTLRCHNLSNSVAIAVYEVLRQSGFDGLSMSR